MSRLLLITYHYPPRHSAGSIRPAGLAKYLQEFGWEVLVLTPRLPQGPRPSARVIETGYADVIARWKSRLRMDGNRGLHEQLNLTHSRNPRTRFIESARSLLTFPDEHRGWRPFALQQVSELAAREHIDLIFSTSPPVSAHVIAAEAKKILGCPWVADFRDLWSQQNLWGIHRLLQPLHFVLEKKTLKTADVLTTVSDPWAGRLRDSYPRKPVYTVTNGFDPDDFPSRAKNLTKEFTITYAGYLYQGKRDPSPLFEVLQQLLNEGRMDARRVRVRFYGPPEGWLQELIGRYGLTKVVELHGMVSRQEVLEREAESQLLLLLGWSDPRETGQHTGKLFEYFGSRRPILAVGGVEGVLTQTLRETEAGVHALNKEQLRQYLLEAYEEYSRKRFVSFYCDQRQIGRYTHREMARKFSELFRATLSGCDPQGLTSPVGKSQPNLVQEARSL